MQSARQARCRGLLRLKGEKHHGVKSPLRDPFPDGWRPAHRLLHRRRPKASGRPSVQSSTKEPGGCVLNAYVHQATECGGPRYAEFDGAQLSIFFITTECANASKP